MKTERRKRYRGIAAATTDGPIIPRLLADGAGNYERERVREKERISPSRNASAQSGRYWEERRKRRIIFPDRQSDRAVQNSHSFFQQVLAANEPRTQARVCTHTHIHSGAHGKEDKIFFGGANKKKRRELQSALNFFLWSRVSSHSGQQQRRERERGGKKSR